MGDDSNCGGAETAAQEECRALAALGMIESGLRAVLLVHLRARQRQPVGIRRVQQSVDRRIGEPVRTQFGADTVRAVTLPHPRAHDHLAEAIVVLIVLVVQTPECAFRFLLVATGMLQPRAQFALRVLAAGEHAERAIVGAALGSIAAHIPVAFHRIGEPSTIATPTTFTATSVQDFAVLHPGYDLRLDFLGIFGRGDTARTRSGQQLGAQGFIQLLRRGRVVLEILTGIFLALPDALATVAVPRARFLDQVVDDAQFDQLALPGGALAVQDFELRLPEGRRDLVLDHFDAGLRTDYLLALLHRADATDIQTYRSIEQ